MLDRKVDRIEVGLFNEFSGTPGPEAFGIDWESDGQRTTALTVAHSDAWLTFPFLPRLAEVMSALSTDDGSAMPASEFAKVLESAGFTEARWDLVPDDALPLPPDEASTYFDPTAIPRRFAAEDLTPWVGPHIARTTRFLDMIDDFIKGLNGVDVPAIDARKGYSEAQSRLWETFSYDMISDAAASRWRGHRRDTPHLMTDTRGYLLHGQMMASIALERSGGDAFPFPRTLTQPLSELDFQVYALEEDQAAIRESCEMIAARVGLKCSWEGPTVRLSLPDLHLYRDHRYAV